ncbi:hypothetical protein KGM_212878 [Danaus plexippus plexippus]|uniref:Uncharacterized protein n=1 Tax=Danaus plexippus plexippus TaxID=278856 RepID=A0A212F6E0_DANPL|nr:hypothetical protein KGM_212878 [Danaus plexippus plexippus]
MERRIRRKKRMPGELASSTDAGLTLRAELQKDMLECLADSILNSKQE